MPKRYLPQLCIRRSDQNGFSPEIANQDISTGVVFAMLKVCLLLISILLATTSIAAEKTAKKKKVDEPVIAVVPPVAAEPVKPWLPTAYDDNADQLPPDYQGVDPAKFLKMFESKVGSLRKDTYETSEEFAQRTANKDLLLSPINTTDLYAFLMKGISYAYYAYNADEQAYPPSIMDICRETHSFSESKDWYTCDVAKIYSNADTYEGRNAYGASIQVQRTRGSNFAIAIRKGSPVLNSSVFVEHRASGHYAFSKNVLTLQVPLSKAREIDWRTIAVLFVGRVTDAKIIDGKGLYSEPKVTAPYDMSVSVKAIPFELKKMVFYVVETGEILAKRNF